MYNAVSMASYFLYYDSLRQPRWFLNLYSVSRMKCPHNFCKCSFKETDEPAKANTSDLNEELGQVRKSELYALHCTSSCCLGYWPHRHRMLLRIDAVQVTKSWRQLGMLKLGPWESWRNWQHAQLVCNVPTKCIPLLYQKRIGIES
jgi:hypothetical protein